MKTLPLSRDRVAHGTFIKTDSPSIVELLGTTPLDFAVIDAEHAPFDRGSLDRLLLAGRAVDLPLVVRVPDFEAASIMAPLDMGAAGIMVPTVDSAEQARLVVSRAKFRGGSRGFSISPRCAEYGTTARAQVLARGDATHVVCQIESVAGLSSVEAIAAVPGVDALFIGRADLALSMGLEDPRAPELHAAVERIAAAARAAGKVCGMHVADEKEAHTFARQGMSWFVIGSDQGLLQKAARAICLPDPAAAAEPAPHASPLGAEAPLSRMQQLMIRLELEELNTEFAYRVDHGPTDQVAGLFTEDGSYGRLNGARSVGRAAISATYAERAAHGERTARHVFTNLRLQYDSADRVRGTAIQTLYAEDGPPPHPAKVLALSDFDDVYVRCADNRWRYESRTITSLFVDESGRKTVLPLSRKPVA